MKVRGNLKRKSLFVIFFLMLFVSTNIFAGGYIKAPELRLYWTEPTWQFPWPQGQPFPKLPDLPDGTAYPLDDLAGTELYLEVHGKFVFIYGAKATNLAGGGTINYNIPLTGLENMIDDPSADFANFKLKSIDIHGRKSDFGPTLEIELDKWVPNFPSWDIPGGDPVE